MGPVVANHVADFLQAEYAKMVSDGATPLLAMKRPIAGTPLLSPTIVDVTGVASIADEELFGPILQVIKVPDLDSAINCANNTRYGLAAGLLSDDDEVWNEFYLNIKAGIVNRNRATTGASGAAPFGGPGLSGNHRPSAFYAADYCAYPMASMLDSQAQLPDQPTTGILL